MKEMDNQVMPKLQSLIKMRDEYRRQYSVMRIIEVARRIGENNFLLEH